MNAQAPLVADRAVVHAFLARLHALADAATAGAGERGVLQLVVIHPAGGAALALQFEIGELEHMVDEAVLQSKTGHNTYIEGRTVRRRARGEKGRGSAADTVAVFALVVDDDADKGKGSRIKATPSLIVESSPGNSHRWFALSQAVPAARGTRLGASIKAQTGGDSDTGVITQPYRVAGTVNYPGKAKIARGRVAVQTSIVSLDGPVWTADDLEAAFPEPERKKTSSAGPRPEGASGKTSSAAEDLAADLNPTDRSAQFFHVVKTAFDDGLTPDDVEALMSRHPDGCAGKYLAPYDRLRREIDRAWDKIEAKAEEARRAAERPIDPTYPDRRVSLAEAEAQTRTVVSAFYSEHIPAWRAARDTWRSLHAAWKDADKEAKAEKRESPPEPQKPAAMAWAARIETGTGKTALAIAGAAEAARNGIVTAYAGPTHPLLTELAGRFAAEGVQARIYRGYTAEDPDAPDLAMCLDLPAMQDARDAGSSVPAAVCKRTVDGQELRCAFIDRCGMERQRNAEAAVWLIPHALLGHMKPAFIPEPDAIIVDEGIVMGALPDKPARMSLDAIERADVEMAGDFKAFTNFANDLTTARGNLLRALRAHGDDGPLRRSLLTYYGVTKALAGSASTMEWERKREANILPGMTPKARKACVAAVGKHNAEIRLLVGIWRELSEFLAGDAETSGRLSLHYDDEAQARFLDRRSLDTIASSWGAPVLAIDATLPGRGLLEPVIGQAVEIRADIAVRWSEHVQARQIVGSPTTASKLGIVEGKQPETARRSVHYLARLIRLRAALAWPRTIAVIAPKKLIEILKGIGLPENVETGHFGAIAGIDRWREAAGLIVIGRLQPGPPVTEAMSGVVTGRVPETIPPDPTSNARWYPKVEAGIRLADGSGVRVEMERHPDSVAEALRAQVTEGQLIQAIGRIRPLRRTAETPAFVDIVSDVPLPISVDRAVSWAEALPGAWADMTPSGVILESEADIMAAFPDLAPTRDAAREHTVATMGVTSIWDTLIGLTPSPATVFAYKRRGQPKPSTGYVLPNRPADLLGWLDDRLTDLEWLKVEGEAEQRPAAPGPESEGVALDSPADMTAAWPERWATPAAARDWRSRNGGIVLPGAPVRFRYQRAGRNQKWRTGAHDPAAVSDPRAWLEARLGALAGFEVVQPSEEPAPEPVAATAPPTSFLPPAPIVVSDPSAKTAALVGTLGHWLRLMRHAAPADPHSRAPLSPVAATFF